MSKTKTPEKPSDEAEPARTAWLTTQASEAFGPTGHIVDLTEAEHAAAPEGLLIAPTAEQLAQRL